MTYVEQLMAVDTAGVEPLLHVLAPSSARRRDLATAVLGPAALAGSPGFVDGLVQVPKVVE